MPSVFTPANEALVNIARKALESQNGGSPNAVAGEFAVLMAFGYTYLAAPGVNEKNLEKVMKKVIMKVDNIIPSAPIRDWETDFINGTKETIANEFMEFLSTYAIPPVEIPGASEMTTAIAETIIAQGNPIYGKPFNSFCTYCFRLMVPQITANVLGYLHEKPSVDGVYPNTKSLLDAGASMFPDNADLAASTAGLIMQSAFISQVASGKPGLAMEDNSVNSAIERFRTLDPEARSRIKSFVEGGYSHIDFQGISQCIPATPGNTAAGIPDTGIAEKVPEQAPQGPAVVTSQTEPERNTPEGLNETSFDLLKGMSVDEEQLEQAVDVLSEGKYPLSGFITTYQPGLTERAVAQLLDKHTDKASHRPYRVTVGEPKERRTVMIPPAFKLDQSPTLWTRAVVTSMGFPFINFTCPPIMELLRGTDPKRVRDAYRNVKAMFKQCKLKKPVAALKEFAHAQYRNCALNALTVDAEELFAAEPGTTVGASVVDPYSRKLSSKGTVQLPVDFLTAFYGILSPVGAVKQYCELTGMSSEDYLEHLSEKGKPPVYILNPKRVMFRRGPKGSILHELFSSKANPVLVRTRIGSHDGGFIIPERLVDLIFAS